MWRKIAAKLTGETAMVSTLLTVVGQPKIPTSAGNGGFSLGFPALPSIDSISDYNVTQHDMARFIRFTTDTLKTTLVTRLLLHSIMLYTNSVPKPKTWFSVVVTCWT